MNMAAGGAADAVSNEFAEFEAAGEVEVGEKPAIESNKPDDKADEKTPAKKPTGRGPREPKAAPAAKAPAADGKAAPKPGEGEEGDDTDEEGEEGEEDEEAEEKAKKTRKPGERISELTKRIRARDRVIDGLTARLDAIEKRGLPAGKTDGNSPGTGKPAPDPTDSAKYPLGHLDDRYIEDKLEWLAEKKAADRADAVLQRQQEGEQNQMLERQQEALLEKVDDLSTRGSELFDDFQEAVVESGMRGDWRLDQPTFEAAHEAENGAQILYDLSQDKAEAKRVAGLSAYQQMKFVMDRDAEISAKAKPRTKPGAGAPPANTPRGANSSTRINPATENLDDFEKAWEQDAKRK